MIVIPDADQTPEQLAGLAPGVAAESQVARRLAESGCHVYVPVLIDRHVAARNGRAKLTSREFVYRSAFELGRHLIGYEVQKVLALVELLARQARGTQNPIGVFGYGEGGAIALYAAALEPRIDAVCVSGYFDDRNDVWRQPVDRNVFGILEQFGDAEVATLVAPRLLCDRGVQGPGNRDPARHRRRTGTAGHARGSRPSRPRSSGRAGSCRDSRPRPGSSWSRADRRATDRSGPTRRFRSLLEALAPGTALKSTAEQPGPLPALRPPAGVVTDRQARQLHELDRHNQRLLVESADVRREFMKKLDFSSPAAYAKSVEPYREFFASEVIGTFDLAPLPPNVRSRQIYDEPKLTGYEVVMDVFPDVIAYGILLVPKGIKPGEKRPVVVCQHGLEGRPRDVADPKVDNPCLPPLRRPAGRGRVHHVRTAEPVHLSRPVPQPAAQGQPAQEDPVFGDRPPAPADHRLAQDAAAGRPRADRVLRPLLRGQVGHADPPPGEELLPVDLLGRLQRMGLEERLDDQPV